MSRLTVIAGPTAVGKGTVVRRIREMHPEIELSVSATTRLPRPGEQHGVDYFFLTNEEFDKMIADGNMLEYAVVHGTNRYGTPREPVERILAAGGQMILEIDIQGARQVKKSMPEALLVFIAPPSWQELERRLSGRGTEDAAEQARRLATAKLEMEAQDEFEAVIINEHVDKCAQQVVDLMQA
jgi:guanylate kinase